MLDQQYCNMLSYVMKAGTQKSNRTGTDTISVFGFPQFRWNIQDGFPLLTTKKLHWKSIVYELLWFISGSSNIKFLKDNGVTIWDEWAGPDGELGPVYGHNWRKWGVLDSVPQKKPNLKQGIKPTYLGVGNGEGKTSNPLGKTWEGMMARCYDKNSTSYSNYGGRGVSVCDSWLQFKSFADDVILLPGWDDKISSEQRWVLDKDRRGDGFLYSPATCMWVTDETNTEISEKFRYTVRKDGIDYDFTNISKFCNDNGIDAKNFSDLWTGNKNAKERYGFQFVNKVLLKSGIDQLQNMIDTIKTNPDSRRNIVMAWNPSTLHHQALPPCHLMFQVNVDDEFLDLHMYQRSADLFLGIPFNIASYGLLLMMLAHVTGKIPRMLYTSYGDLHLYVNHLDQAKEQITRKPFPLPHVALNPKVKNIDDFTFDDIKLIGYEAHPSIKAEISV